MIPPLLTNRWPRDFFPTMKGVLIETTIFKTLKRQTWIPKKEGLEDDFPFQMDNFFQDVDSKM